MFSHFEIILIFQQNWEYTSKIYLLIGDYLIAETVQKARFSSFSRCLIVFSNVGLEFFTKFYLQFSQFPFVITITHYVVQNYVITAWHIGGGVQDEEQQLKTKFGAELAQELCCLVSKLVCVETKKIFLFKKIKNARKIVFHQVLSLKQKLDYHFPRASTYLLIQSFLLSV